MRAHWLRRGGTVAGLIAGLAVAPLALAQGGATAQGEIGLTRTTASIVTHGRSGYLTLGRRFGDLQPYLGYAISRPEGERLQALTDWSVIGQRGLQDAALFAINGTRIDQATTTVGARWDLGQRIALKGQWDHIRIKAQGYALWFREFKLNARDTSVNLVTLALDFVF